MSESWATIVPHSQNSSSLFPASLGPSASIFSKSLPFKSLGVGCKNATDCIFVCLRCLQVLWEAHRLCWALECMCFSSQIPSETSGIQTHPKLSLHLSAVSPNLLLHTFPVCFFFSELWTVLCGFFLFIYSSVLSILSSRKVTVFTVCWFSCLISVRPQRQQLLTYVWTRWRAMMGMMTLELLAEASHPLPPNSPTPYVSFPFSQVPTKPANLSK